jgi:hypothetical protein
MPQILAHDRDYHKTRFDPINLFGFLNTPFHSIQSNIQIPEEHSECQA